jgi:aryl-alcohol dehydrogenase-like predicted oxidoreductase
MTHDRIVLGTSKLGVDGRDAAFELLDEYVALGGRTIDTASVYSDWIAGERGRRRRRSANGSRRAAIATNSPSSPRVRIRR